MTATDELRRMLDKRGVEWKAPNSCLRDEMTMWTAGGFDYEAFEVPELDGTFLLTAANDDLTPEQVIAATLGHRTTTRYGKFRTKYGRSVLCCECCGYGIGDERWHFCPSCGAEVVE